VKSFGVEAISFLWAGREVRQDEAHAKSSRLEGRRSLPADEDGVLQWRGACEITVLCEAPRLAM